MKFFLVFGVYLLISLLLFDIGSRFDLQYSKIYISLTGIILTPLARIAFKEYLDFRKKSKEVSSLILPPKNS